MSRHFGIKPEERDLSSSVDLDEATGTILIRETLSTGNEMVRNLAFVAFQATLEEIQIPGVTVKLRNETTRVTPWPYSLVITAEGQSQGDALVTMGALFEEVEIRQSN